MKLLANYYRTTILTTILIVLLSSCAYFFIIHFILLEQLDDALAVEEQEVIDYVNRNGVLPESSDYEDQQVTFAKAPDNRHVRNFTTLKLFNKGEEEELSYRQLVFSINAGMSPWLVQVRKSQEETDDLVRLILLITLVIVISLLLILFLVNRFILRRLWKPFYSTLLQLREFNLSGKAVVSLETGKIDEFNELNQAVLQMTDRVKEEYNSLKNFTDNASHELQTPLAVINSKLDLLIQDEQLSETQMEKLQFIYEALNKMSRMNQALLLLARLESSQFGKPDEVFVDLLINEKFILFEDLIINRQLRVEKEINSMQLRGNMHLIDILVTNLISNAIHYSNKNGTLTVKLGKNQLVVSNTSQLPELDRQKIFQRFYRHSEDNKDGNGLGLSILKQICTASGYQLQYMFRHNTHCFQVTF